ncbi:MAG TPA: hypothetical protein VGW12_21970 [Pyrinomonadaceae bacterium]|nr:hypothetical protein [Pyrinomonadaceae bacterium]
MKKKRTPASVYAVCINNDGYRASLEVGKLYQLIADEAAEADGMLRVIDESGEDYLFEAARFFPVELPPALVKELRRVY